MTALKSYDDKDMILKDGTHVANRKPKWFDQDMYELLLFESKLARKPYAANHVYEYQWSNVDCITMIVKMRGQGDDHIGITLNTPKGPFGYLIRAQEYKTWKKSRFLIVQRMWRCFNIYYTPGKDLETKTE
jgi:hypothetical protein